MTFLSRVAGSAALIAIIAVAGVSTPGRADNLDRPLIATPSLPVDATVTAPSTLQPAQPSAQSTPTSSDDDSYASLAEAIADRQVPQTLDGDLRCLAEAVYFEAKGEPLAGQLAVAQVILNRAQSGRFPKSVCSVVTQAGQFAFVRGGKLPATPRLNGQFRTAVAIAMVAMDGDWDSDAPDALFFHARRVTPAWRMTRVASIGNHVFYR